MAMFKNTTGTLIGLYNQTSVDSNSPIFIVLDMESGESWPRLRNDEVSYSPAVKAKWRDRYIILAATNANLPKSTYFTTSE